jgi:hypothetical protein
MVRTGPVKPEATLAVTCTGEVRVALLSGVVIVTPPEPVREAVRLLGEGLPLYLKKAMAPTTRMRRMPRTTYWIKPRWVRRTREDVVIYIMNDAQVHPSLL